MPTAWSIVPDRFDDGRHLSIEKGLERAGYTVRRGEGPPGDERDVLVTWTRHRGYKDGACTAFEAAGGRVLVCEEGYTRYLADKHFAISLHDHHHATLPPDIQRWWRLGIETRPWREIGTHVLVCGQRGIGSPRMASPAEWHADAAQEIRANTARPVRVRVHPGKDKSCATPLSRDLQGCWAVVVWSSNCAVRALVEGIPVIYRAPNAVFSEACGRGLDRVDRPVMGDRDRAFGRIAANQWTPEEIERGVPFAALL